MLLLDSLALVSLAAYTLVVLVTVVCAPKQDRTPENLRAIRFAFLGTAVAYAAASPWLFVAGWALTLAPLWRGYGGLHRPSRFVLFGSTAVLAVGVFLATLSSDESVRIAGFVAISLAALVRKGIFPFHFWAPCVMESAPPSYLNVLMNGHLGAYVLIRFGLTLFPDVAAQALPIIGTLAIVSSMYTAILALVSRRPRRTLALVCVSQASFILGGLQCRNVEGITGALVHWWVVAFATTILLSVYRALEVRTTEVESPAGYVGLGLHAPRLAVCFSVAAFALVGLPGTLGFAAEDLLFHGALESYAVLGIGLPLATALNAITVLRLIATLFWGRRGSQVPRIPDARRRERWGLAVPVLVLVVGGIAPGVVVALREPSAEWIAALLTGL